MFNRLMRRSKEFDHEQGYNIQQDLAIVEVILRNRYHFFAEIRDGIELPRKIRSMLVSSIIFFAIYGAVLGSNSSLAQALSSAVKLPIMFLATLFICAPTLYFFNVFFGSGQSIAQNIALILTAISVTSVLVFSFAPVTLFFLLATSQYQFFKLLNVGIFGIAGLMGLFFLAQGMKVVSHDSREGANSRIWVMRLWMVLYGFVGSQLAWTIRPFIGAPDIEFELFRQLGGNFYTNIFASLGEILGFLIVQ